jgi:hypothetical protein
MPHQGGEEKEGVAMAWNPAKDEMRNRKNAAGYSEHTGS